MNGNDRIWKGINNKCIDCDKIIEGRSIRCKSCWNKTRKGIKKSQGENHGNWKGDKVGYSGLHVWVRKNKLKPKLCVDCKKAKPYDLANISQEYKRDINDFKWLCRSCHIKKDGRLNKLIRKGGLRYGN